MSTLRRKRRLPQAPQSAGKAQSGRKERQEGFDANARSGSIVWRATGLGSFDGSGSFRGQLLDDREYDCPFCHGRGKVAGASVCPVCNGSRKVQVEPPAVNCAFCGGHGQVPARSNLTCWVCKGKGVVSVEPPVRTCPDCQGRGKEAWRVALLPKVSRRRRGKPYRRRASARRGISNDRRNGSGVMPHKHPVNGNKQEKE